MDFIKKSTAARISYLLTAADKSISDSEKQRLSKSYSEAEITKIQEEYDVKLKSIIDDEDYFEIITEWCDKLLESEPEDEGHSDPDEMSVRSFISDMILLAQCDGEQAVNEAKLIRHIARKAGMSATLFSDIMSYRTIAMYLDKEREEIFASDYEYSLMRPYADSFDKREKNLKIQLQSYLDYYAQEDKVMCCEKLNLRREIIENNQPKIKVESVFNVCAIAAIDPIFGGAAALLKSANNRKDRATETIKKANEEAFQRAQSRMNTIEKQCKTALDAIAEEKTFILTNSFRHFINYLGKIKNVSTSDSEVINEVLNLKGEVDSVYKKALTVPESSSGARKMLTYALVAVAPVPPTAFAIEVSKFLKLNKEYEKARAESADVAVAIEKMNIQAVKLIAIRAHIYLNYMQLVKLDSFFTPMVFEFRKILETQGYDYSQYDENSRKIIASACSLAKTLKVLIDAPVLNDEGDLSEESKESMNRVEEKIEELR